MTTTEDILECTHFGRPEIPPPDWRKERIEEDDEDGDEKPADPGLIALLGFDPDEAGGYTPAGQ